MQGWGSVDGIDGHIPEAELAWNSWYQSTSMDLYIYIYIHIFVACCSILRLDNICRKKSRGCSDTIKNAVDCMGSYLYALACLSVRRSILTDSAGS